ncbi:MAG TPA: O-methyltransferase [Flavobacteriales bacterium]
MQFIDPALDIYAERHGGPEARYLQELSSETRAKVHAPEMLSGHLQGRLLSLLSHLVRPRTIVEIGTFTGYSALCLAEGLAEGGQLHTIDIDPHLKEIVQRYIAKAGMQDRIVTHHRPALEVIPTLPAPFDLVFIDADKPNYPNYFDAVIDRMRPGGLIIADNVLWSGRVLQSTAEQDEATRAIIAYNTKVLNDPRVEQVVVPLRDGLSVARLK